MGALAPDELAGQQMNPTWRALVPVKSYYDAMAQFLREEYPSGTLFDVAGVNVALKLCIEFNEIWSHRVPTCWELVLADRAGRLPEQIQAFNDAFAQGE